MLLKKDAKYVEWYEAFYGAMAAARGEQPRSKRGPLRVDGEGYVHSFFGMYAMRVGDAEPTLQAPHKKQTGA